jgi:hypothetical protein
MGIVQELGALAGAATLVGLPLLATLHVSQAREVRRLRERADGPRGARALWPRRRAGGSPARLRAARVIAAAPQSLAGASRPRAVVAALAGASRPRAVVAALAGALVVVAVVNPFGGADPPPAARPKRTPVATVEPGDVTVAVLNGTTVPGLAATLRERLSGVGFEPGVIDVNVDQQLVESVVQYRRGHAAAARLVGRALGISRRAPATAASRARAADATVIVIAGADQAP